MTTAEKLALTLFQAQKRIKEILTRTHEQLLSQRDDLRQAEGLPADAVILNQQCLNLMHDIEVVRQELGELQSQHTQLKERLQQRLAAAWTQLKADYQKQVNNSRTTRVTKDFQEAMTAFTAELRREGVIRERATPAQLRSQLPLLKNVASVIRDQMRALADEFSQKYSNLLTLRQKQGKLSERREGLKDELQKMIERLNEHASASGQLRITADILLADKMLLKRLKREILEPVLLNARIERAKGLFGKDPLWQLQVLHRK